ncbi:hypothetical protein ACP70R_003273 [Stipagrostis hirtigluma subsp. patula]
MVVDGEEVPLELEVQYREYCRRSASCEGKSCICHMCFFEWQRSYKAQDRNIIIHCRDIHKDIGVKCENRYCQVRFREGNCRDTRLHMHFCHILPKGWWMD